MNTHASIIWAALVAVFTTPLMAQSSSKPTPIDRGRNLTDQQRKNMLKKFDRDRNGKIDGKGRHAAKKALRGQKAGRPGRSGRSAGKGKR